MSALVAVMALAVLPVHAGHKSRRAQLLQVQQPVQAMREQGRTGDGISIDQAIQIAERRFGARVVRADVAEVDGRRVYVLRLLSEKGVVRTVKIDAETGGAR
jgi:uncharacterized membrane protein YkoI